ncbi:helix-turn-helix domain-containing protein [Streptomyces sp. NPDC086787]|uniref:helix-turn-helix domain-containing protein n=1 Tax=Streptomyces sp. NPDC086787 TaxID=3365759 RepID=UPI00382CCCE7
MTQKRATPTVMRRRVGAQLRRYREPLMKSGDAAKLMGWDTTRLSRIERGLYRISAEEVRTLCDHYGVDDREAITEISKAAEEPPGGGWWAPYAGRVSDAYLDFIELEAGADAIRIHHPIVIPGPLQSPGYAREILTRAATNLSKERAEMLVRIRLARQDILSRDDGPVQLHALVPEPALHARFDSGPRVMRDQVRALIDASEMSNVRLQVVPLTTHPAYATKGPMTLLSFRHPWVPVGSVDNSMGGTHTEDPEQLNWLDAEFELLSSCALPEDKSQDLLNEYLEGLYK